MDRTAGSEPLDDRPDLFRGQEGRAHDLFLSQRPALRDREVNRPLPIVHVSQVHSCRTYWGTVSAGAHGRLCVAMDPSSTTTLYKTLAVPAPEGVAAGETNRTLSKETLDADDEPLLEAVVIGA